MAPALMADWVSEGISLSHRTRRERGYRVAQETVAARRSWGRDELHAFQTCALKALVLQAYEHIPFYRDHYTAAGFEPGAVSGLNDLGRIPLLTRSDLSQTSALQLRNSQRRAPARLLTMTVAEGRQLQLYRDEASLWHILARQEANLRERSGVQPPESVPASGSLASTLEEFLRIIHPETRLAAFLGGALLTIEAGLTAYECERGQLHLAEEGVLCEIVDAAGNATVECGELVVSDLTNWATPIIRYRGLGIRCRWTTPCPCGSVNRTIERLD